VSGQVGAAASWTIGLPSGSTPGQVSSAQDAVQAASNQLTDAEDALAASQRTKPLTLGGDRAAIAATPAGAARAEARRQLALDDIHQSLAVQGARSAVDMARRALAAARRDLAAVGQTETSVGTTVTSLPESGAAIDRGDTLYAIDGRPTLLLIGASPAYRAMRTGDVGHDVGQLQTNLVALGFGRSPALSTRGTFDAATAAAVRAWQSANGLPASGVVRLGDVVFLPTAVDVAAWPLAIGGAARAGDPILDVASVDPIVRIALDPLLAASVRPGDALRLTLPGGVQAPAHVQTVGRVATPTTGGQSSGGQSNNGQGGGPVAIAVTATADDPSQLAGLDGASIEVEVTTATATGVLAVPVNALLVLADGSFGVELAGSPNSRIARVQTGIYDQTLVEVSGADLAPGALVVVPAQ
jgi:peptidoglycan hydrolase-like protein with peptidoglycan-binding domain